MMQNVKIAQTVRIVDAESGKPGNLGHFCEKSGKTWNSQGILYTFYPNQRNVRENRLFSLYVIFIIPLYIYSQSGCSICCQ